MSHEIDSYSFGKMVVDGKTYTQDLIIYPDSIQDSWWREQGHSLAPEDIPHVIKTGPEVLVIGTGANGVLKVPKSTKDHLLEIGIEVIDVPTGRAVTYFNRLKDKKETVGAFHLTC